MSFGHGVWTLASAGALAALAVAGCGGPELGVPPQVCSTDRPINAGRSERMEPGGTCITCHASDEGPRFLVAGTVMNALHDDTNCGGVEGVVVRLTGADGRVIELTSNSSGNFYSQQAADALVFPYQAEVSRAGKTVKMLTPRAAGETECNVCHTAGGARAAPGRIVAP